MTGEGLPPDILYGEITPELWENDPAGPIVIANQLRGYIAADLYLGRLDEVRQAEAQLNRLRKLVPDIDKLVKEHDEEMELSRNRKEREI